MNGGTVEDLLKRALDALGGARPEGNEPAGQVPVAEYVDADRLLREQALLRRQPQPIAASTALQTPGSWLAQERFGIPFLLVRQDDGHVEAFLNVCRHRGARVVKNGRGDHARNFVCPYHAWTYACDGTLKAVPQEFGFPCLDKKTSGLRRLAVGERAGLIWVVLDPERSNCGINEQLGSLMQELESLDLASPVEFAPRSYEVAANWKLLLDGSFEAYHFKVVHRATIAALFRDNLQIVDEEHNNRRLFLVKASLDPKQPPPANVSALRQHGNILYFFFPNTTFLVQPDHTQFSTLEPLAPDRTRVHEITLLPSAPRTAKAEKYWQANVDLYRRTLAEDYVMAESIQSGLASGANDALSFGTFEFSAPRFHRQLETAMSRLQPPSR